MTCKGAITYYDEVHEVWWLRLRGSYSTGHVCVVPDARGEWFTCGRTAGEWPPRVATLCRSAQLPPARVVLAPGTLGRVQLHPLGRTAGGMRYPGGSVPKTVPKYAAHG